MKKQETGYLLNVQYDITGIEKPSWICESIEKNMRTERPAVTAHTQDCRKAKRETAK